MVKKEKQDSRANNTDDAIPRVEHFRDDENNVFGLDVMQINKDTWQQGIQPGWMHITEDEARAIANPPLTPEQIKAVHISDAESKKQYLIAEAHTEIQVLKIKYDLKRIKPAELELLNAWLDYLDELEAIDTSTAPDIEWPQRPW